jgi:MarR family transcriptional regulator, organic hydroperoxide resistance regulator
MKRKLMQPEHPPELSQKPAKKHARKHSEERRCSQNLGRIVKGYRALLEDSLREEGLTLPQLRLLKAINEQAGASAAALARTCYVTPQTMQSILTRAVREQWIVRGKSSGNNRIVTASLTPLGKAVLERGSQMSARIEETLWHGVDRSTLKQLNAILEAGIANLDQELKRQGKLDDHPAAC